MECRTAAYRSGMGVPARGGSAESRYGAIDDIAWFENNSGDASHRVSQKRSNGFGLFDALGNAWEWNERLVRRHLLLQESRARSTRSTQRTNAAPRSILPRYPRF